MHDVLARIASVRWASVLAIVGAHLVFAALAWAALGALWSRARRATGPVWLLVAWAQLVAYALVSALDFVLARGDARSGVRAALERLVFGHLRLTAPFVPLEARPLLALPLLALVIGTLYVAAVALVWNTVVAGRHLEPADRAAGRAWLGRWAGWSTPKGPDASLVRWLRPASWVLVALVIVGFGLYLFSDVGPSAGALISFELFAFGAWRARRPDPSAADDDEPTEQGTSTTEGTTTGAPAAPPTPLDVDQLIEAIRKADEGGGPSVLELPVRAAVQGASDGGTLASKSAPLSRLLDALLEGGAPRPFQSRLVETSEALGRGLVVGAHGTGRSTALTIATLHALLTRAAPTLLVTPDDARAVWHAKRLDRALEASGLGGLFAIELADEETTHVRAGTSVLVLSAATLASLVARSGAVDPCFAGAIGLVAVDDLDDLDAVAQTQLRCGLARLLRRERASTEYAVLATATPIGEGMEAWASEVLGEPGLVVSAADGAPMPALRAIVLSPPAGRSFDSLEWLPRQLASSGRSMRVVDEARRGLRPFTLPWLIPEPPGASGSNGPAIDVILTTGADARSAVDRHRPVGAPDGATLSIVVVVDGGALPVDGPPREACPLASHAGEAAPHVLAMLSEPVTESWLVSQLPARVVDQVLDRARERRPWTLTRSSDARLTPEHDRIEPVNVVQLTGAVPDDLPSWIRKRRVEILEGGAPIALIDADLAPAVFFPGATVAHAGRLLDVAKQRDGHGRTVLLARRRAHASRRAGTTTVRSLRGLAIEESSVEFHTEAEQRTKLAVDLHEVAVEQETGCWLETDGRGSGGDDSLGTNRKVTFPSIGARVGFQGDSSATGTIPPAARLALEVAIQAALLTTTTLRADDVAVVASAESLGAEERLVVWIVDRAAGGHGGAEWLHRNLLGRPTFWRFVGTLLQGELHRRWANLRTDDGATGLDPVGAWRLIVESTPPGDDGWDPAPPRSGPRDAPRAGACRACHQEGTGHYVYADGSRICPQCLASAEECDFCGKKANKDATRYADGRFQCPACRATAVQTREELEPFIAEALELAVRVLRSRVAKMPLVLLADAHAIAQEQSLTFKPTRKLDKRAVGLFSAGGASGKIFVELGKPSQEAIGTIAHEYAHAWQYERNPSLRRKETVEGFASWVQYHVFRAMREPERARRLLTWDPPYGSGLREMLDIEKRGGGPQAVLDFVTGDEKRGRREA
jgi:hypothetical protein